ncbi:hypothetical protein DHW03_12700 [Pedobacter yonginense]|uniref:Uncharacterized protein n=1 Tax=Pedobacter yonginense TaxID=651869 RepID=A0A317EJ56_9SPHI|nr:hypothetical protein [Pedobacter yonginense]PWS26881.1 hypothetical protein DHW03_12700 [Pedobacter yonginense]
MKKLTILMLCIATLGLASCKKDTIVQSAQNIVVVRDVTPNQWVLSTNGQTYSADLAISAIDAYHVDNEGTLVYISYNNGASYIQLPFVYNVDAYSYEVYPGGLSIDIQSSDLQNRAPIRPTSSVRIKVVLIATD